jgi:hypothetical protein
VVLSRTSSGRSFAISFLSGRRAIAPVHSILADSRNAGGR